MKIKFVIDNDPIVEANTWKEILKYRNVFYYTFTKDSYCKFKALELNQDFDKEISKSRENLGIPVNGLPIEDGYKMISKDNTLRTAHMDDKFKERSAEEAEFMKRVWVECGRIEKKLKLDILVSCFIRELLLSNYVESMFSNFADTGQISYAVEEDYSSNKNIPSMVFIQITANISKNKLKNFIESNWKLISKDLARFPNKNSFNVTERDLKIVSLRDSYGLSFPKIADKIIEDFNIDNSEGKINDYSVKIAYKRTKNKIESLAKSKYKKQKSK